MGTTVKNVTSKTSSLCVSFALALLVLLFGANIAFAEQRYSRDGAYHRQHQNSAFGSYKYPRGQTTPGAGLAYGNRPGDGLNRNRVFDNQRNSHNNHTYRDNRRHDRRNSGRSHSNAGPQARHDSAGQSGGNTTRSEHGNRDRAGNEYGYGYSRGFERGYSKGRRDRNYGSQHGSRNRLGNNRIYQQSPYGGQSRHYQTPNRQYGRSQQYNGARDNYRDQRRPGYRSYQR